MHGVAAAVMYVKSLALAGGRARVRVMRLPKGAKLSARDFEELAKFAEWLKLEESRRAGGDPCVLNTVELALYPEGVGREPADGSPEA